MKALVSLMGFTSFEGIDIRNKFGRSITPEWFVGFIEPRCFIPLGGVNI